MKRFGEDPDKRQYLLEEEAMHLADQGKERIKRCNAGGPIRSGSRPDLEPGQGEESQDGVAVPDPES